jgi:N-acetylmuramoyl-L-alanine amidase
MAYLGDEVRKMAPLVILDPGHGGIDPGGGSNRLFTESEMTLRISLYQYERFQELKVPVAITRKSDETLSIEARANLVRNSGARYCISNHINSGGGRGSEIIYSIYASSALPRELADELEAEGMPNRRIFTRTLPGKPNQDYYFMHRETGSVETVIVEYGFADNPTDAQKIYTDWRDLAEAVVRGFCRHTKQPYRLPSNDSPQPVPEWKREAVEWLYEQGLLTDAEWRSRMDEPLPLWAEAAVLRRLFDKLNS